MLKLEHVKKTFNKGSANEVILYRDLNVEIHDGEFVTIIGSNGSGKSTFFNVISGNIRQDAGSVSFNGRMFPVFLSINAPSLSDVYFRTRRREPPFSDNIAEYGNGLS